MAEAVEVGKLVVRLIGDAKQLETALSKGSADLKKFGSEADKASRQATKSAEAATKGLANVAGRLAALAAAYVSVNAVVGAFNNSIANVTALDHLSQATGASVERLSELRNIALATGVDFETVGRAFAQFGARMTEALASPTSRGSQALRALGVDVRDAQGNIRQLDELLPEMADRFSQFANGSNKAAIAAAIFGEEAGPKMLALLNKGKAGLEELRRQLGSTFTAEDVQKARNYQETVAKLQIAFEKFFQEFVRAAGPTVIEILNKLTSALNSMKVPTTFREELANVDKQIQGLMTETVRLNQILLQMEKGTFFERFFGQTSPEKIKEQLAKINQELQDLIMRRGVLAERTMGEFVTTVKPEGQQAPAMDPLAIERAQFALDQLMERLTGTRDILDEMNFAWSTHADRVAMAVDKINRVHEAGFKRDRAITQATNQLRRMEQQQMLDTASVAAQTITALWPKQKGAAIASAVINTAVGVTRAFASLNPPWSFATAALIAAAGAAQIASIRSTNETGGSSAAPSVSAPTAEAPAAQQASPSRALFISGLDPNAIFSGKQLEELIRAISNEVQNGVTLISTRNLPI